MEEEHHLANCKKVPPLANLLAWQTSSLLLLYHSLPLLRRLLGKSLSIHHFIINHLLVLELVLRLALATWTF
jgi:hypothetical protein